MKRIALPLLLLLAACGTPQEQCIAQNTRDLRVVTRLANEAEGNLARGYALEEYEVVVPTWENCIRLVPGTKDNPEPREVVTTCRGLERETRTRPQSIDLAQERIKLAQLRQRQRALEVQVPSITQQCQALYPEKR